MANKSTKHSVEEQIDAQIQKLITNAPDLAVSEAIKAIAPTLKNIALHQKQLSYFLLQSPSGNLALTTLSNVKNPKVIKNVVYAYPSLAIAAQNQVELIDSKIVEVEIIPLLFQFLGIVDVDSLILDGKTPKEIERQKLFDLCQIQLKLKITNNTA